MPPTFYILNSPSNHPQRLSPQELTKLARHTRLNSVGLSFDASSLNTDWPNYFKSAQAAGLSIQTVRISLDVRSKDLTQSLYPTLLQIHNHTHLIELLLHSSSAHDPPSSPRADHHAAELVKQLAQPPTARLALCHSTDNWLHSITDASRLAIRINRPNVGLSFNLPHQLQPNNKNLQAYLLMALPKLWNVTINFQIDNPTNPAAQFISWRNGSDHNCQNFLALLHRLGYQGPIGLAPQSINSTNLNEPCQDRLANHQNKTNPRQPWM